MKFSLAVASILAASASAFAPSAVKTNNDFSTVSAGGKSFSTRTRRRIIPSLLSFCQVEILWYANAVIALFYSTLLYYSGR
jgi:hypothetical protein